MYYIWNSLKPQMHIITSIFLRFYLVRKSLLFFLLIWFLPKAALSQNNIIDSLKNELLIHPEKDSVRLNLLNELAFASFSKDLPRTIEYLDEADAIAEVIDFKKGEARSIYIRGITEAVQGNYEQALIYYNTALKLYESIGYKKGIANTYNAMGITYKNIGELRKSVAYYEKAIKIEEQIGSNNLSASLLNLGTSYSEIGENDKALLYLKEALAIAEKDRNDQRIAYSLNNIGSIYRDIDNYPLALEYFNKSSYILEKIGDSIGYSNNLTNIGWIYKTLGRYDKAMDFYQRSMKIDKRLNRTHSINSIINDIGLIYEAKGDYKTALKNYLEALDNSKRIGSKRDFPVFLLNIGRIHLILGDYQSAKLYFSETQKTSTEIEDNQSLCEAYIGLSKIYTFQKEFSTAQSYAIRAKKISENFSYLAYQKDASEILSTIYTAMGNYKDALESYKQYKTLNDSLFNKENIEKITQLEYDYQYKQQMDSASIRELKLNQTILSTEKDLKKSQQRSFIAVIVILVLSIISGTIIFLMKLRNEKAKNQVIAIEQKLLRSQMTPHFIFNSLSVLQGMILNKEEKKSVSYLSKFSKLLRAVLENSRQKTVTLSEELSTVQSYVELQNMDTQPPFYYQVNIDQDIRPNSIKIPAMLIQPFIENAIEHAFPDRVENKEITVKIRFDEGKLECLIADNGIGIDQTIHKARSHKKSLATSITSERLKILSRSFKYQGSVDLKDRAVLGESGTLVTLIIPYKTDLDQ